MAITTAQALQGGVAQQPVDQHGLGAGQPIRTHRQQLGAAGGGLAEGIGADPMDQSLGRGPRTLHRLPPGSSGIHGDQVAAGEQLGQGEPQPARPCIGPSPVANAQGGAAVDLHPQMGAQSDDRVVAQGPVLHGQLELPGPWRQHRALAWAGDGHLGMAPGQGVIDLGHAPGGRHFLQPAGRRRGWQGLRAAGRGRGAVGLAAAAGGKEQQQRQQQRQQGSIVAPGQPPAVALRHRHRDPPHVIAIHCAGRWRGIRRDGSVAANNPRQVKKETIKKVAQIAVLQCC